MDIFAASIKEKYQERLINREKQWPPCHSNKLVRLELVEREKGEDFFTKGRGRDIQNEKDRNDEGVKRTHLAYSDLFKVESGKKPVRKVLVEGDAGIGKTTLSISVSEDWANGKLFQQFELVLLLPLRITAVAAVDSIPDLLKLLYSSKKLCGSIADSLEEMEGRKVLIIADGWDELAESGRLEGSFLYKLVLGELLPFVSFVLTSRPSASAPLHQLSCIDRFVEVRGFSKEHIIDYIQSEFASDQKKAGRLLEQLEYNPLVESVCSVPLNCAIVCHLWRTLEEALPSTMTELYKKIILNVILRNIQKKDAYKHVSNLPNFDALPNELQQSWVLLCKFAFEGIRKDQIVFSQEELADIFPHGLADVLCFGLLQTASTILETGYGISFHFLHLTFQEYLAAFFLVKQISDQTSLSLPSKQFEEYLLIAASRHDVLFRFTCGIFFNEIEHRTFTDFRPFISSIKHSTDCTVLCHCAFEAKGDSKSFVNEIEKIYNSFKACSAHDCTAILYVIANMQENTVTQSIRFDNSGIRENQVRELADILAGKKGMLQVEELDLSDNNLTDKCVSNLIHRAVTSFRLLSQINLKGNRIGSNSIKLLRKSTFNRLSCLTLSDCPLGVSGMQALEEAVCTGCLHELKKLNLARSLTNDADVNGALLATSLGAIMSCNLSLTSLDLSRNNLGVPGASALARVLCQRERDYTPLESGSASAESISIQVIHLDETNLGDEGLVAIVECSSHITVSDLSLNGNGIHATGISYLADGVCAGKIVLNILSLDDNPLGLEGVAVLGRMLSNSFCQLWVLSLCRCQLTIPASRFLGTNHDSDIDNAAVGIIGEQLCQKNTTEFLYLNGNSFTGEGAHTLANLLYLCPSLQSLHSSHCGITSDDLKQLLDQLSTFKTSSNIPCCIELDSWDLSNNQIDDGGAIALMDHLPSLFPKLGYSFFLSGVSFNGNHISSEVMRRIREEMKQHHEVIQNNARLQYTHIANSNYDVISVEKHVSSHTCTLDNN